MALDLGIYRRGPRIGVGHRGTGVGETIDVDASAGIGEFLPSLSHLPALVNAVVELGADLGEPTT